MTQKLRRSALTLPLATLAAAIMSVPGAAPAFQPDSPFLAYQEKNKDKWAEEDKQINAKLAALEKKFGKN